MSYYLNKIDIDNSYKYGAFYFKANKLFNKTRLPFTILISSFTIFIWSILLYIDENTLGYFELTFFVFAAIGLLIYNLKLYFLIKSELPKSNSIADIAIDQLIFLTSIISIGFAPICLVLININFMFFYVVILIQVPLILWLKKAYFKKIKAHNDYDIIKFADKIDFRLQLNAILNSIDAKVFYASQEILIIEKNNGYFEKIIGMIVFQENNAKLYCYSEPLLEFGIKVIFTNKETEFKQQLISSLKKRLVVKNN